MKFLVIGLGSMGKRRIRCLKALGYNEIYGFDPREDRRQESVEKYNIEPIKDLTELDMNEITGFIISTPPDLHTKYIELAIKNNKPSFIEASVVLDNLEELNEKAKDKGIFIAPSTTMTFHPAIKKIIEIVKSEKYGKITNFSYHSGQYLPDWHPWEKVKDFYVSKKETGGGREIVPFELTWMVSAFGFPKKVTGFFGKTMDVGADIDDTYVVALEFDKFLGSMIVDVVSRYATRSLIINMEEGQINWRWDENNINLYETKTNEWKKIDYSIKEAEEGYNKNITEDMYVEEINAFLEGIKNKDNYPNNLDDDIKILKILLEIENSKGEKND